MNQASPSIQPSPAGRHPRGIYTLFLTEMWERMSFHGMKVLLVLYLVDRTRGGRGLSDEVALSIFGLYTSLVYIAALPGGWIGDRVLGSRRSVWWGGVAIALGHLMLALEQDAAFYSGLIVIAFGSGLLKTNISVMVAGLYPESGARRDAGFTLFYMGVNLGSFIGQMVCSNLGEHWGWRLGFGAATAGMILGLVQYQLSQKHLEGVGEWRPQPGQNVRRDRALLLSALVLVSTLVVLCIGGVIPFDPVAVARFTSVVIVALAVLFYGWVFVFAKLTAEESRRMVVTIILFVCGVLYFAGFAQGASSLTLFAERFTVREIGGWKIAAGMFQSLNPLMVMLLSPLLVMLWTFLARRGIELRLGTKLGLGLLLLAAAFAIAAASSHLALASGPVSPLWLVAVFAFITLGELCISPVGLSAVTKLAPQRLASRMMGVWFLASSLGYLLAGLFAAQVTGDAAVQMPVRFLQVVATVGVTGIVLLACARRIQRLMPGVK